VSKVIETRTEHISLDDDGIVRCKVKPTDEHLLADAVENVQATSELVGGRRVLLLLDARTATKIDREAREYYTGPENGQVVRATAMLIASSVGRIIGNFILRVNHPPFPFRLFSDEESANTWLRELMAATDDDGPGDT
jgi:hypothetical protein